MKKFIFMIMCMVMLITIESYAVNNPPGEKQLLNIELISPSVDQVTVNYEAGFIPPLFLFNTCQLVTTLVSLPVKQAVILKSFYDIDAGQQDIINSYFYIEYLTDNNTDRQFDFSKFHSGYPKPFV